MTGFWQAIVNANQCPLAVDGNFGSLTTWYTAVFQNAIVGGNNGGVMTPGYLYAVQHASSVYGDRLVNLFITDGYGTKAYGYYAGIESDAVRLGWNPISAQWLFSQTPFSNPAALVPATPTRTISSVAACS